MSGNTNMDSEARIYREQLTSLILRQGRFVNDSYSAIKLCEYNGTRSCLKDSEMFVFATGESTTTAQGMRRDTRQEAKSESSHSQSNAYEVLTKSLEEFAAVFQTAARIWEQSDS